MSKKSNKRQQRQLELLKHFEGDFYQEKKVGDNWYIKMWNGGNQKWQVAVFTQKSFRNYKSYKNFRDESQKLDDDFYSKID